MLGELPCFQTQGVGRPEVRQNLVLGPQAAAGFEYILIHPHHHRNQAHEYRKRRHHTRVAYAEESVAKSVNHIEHGIRQ